MVSMVRKVFCLAVVRRALSLPVMIDDQVPREPHQPVLQVTLSRIVLFQRSINANENVLRQILGGIRARWKAVGEIVYAPRIAMHNFFPCRPVSGTASP